MKTTVSDIEFNLSQLSNGNVVGIEIVDNEVHVMFGLIDGLKQRITKLKLSIEAAIMLGFLIDKRLKESNIVVTVTSSDGGNRSLIEAQIYRDA